MRQITKKQVYVMNTKCKVRYYLSMSVTSVYQQKRNNNIR